MAGRRHKDRGQRAEDRARRTKKLSKIRKNPCKDDCSCVTIRKIKKRRQSKIIIIFLLPS